MEPCEPVVVIELSIRGQSCILRHGTIKIDVQTRRYPLIGSMSFYLAFRSVRNRPSPAHRFGAAKALHVGFLSLEESNDEFETF